MADNISLAATVGAPINAGTPLLGGIAWVDKKRLVTAGRNGQTYYITVGSRVVGKVTGTIPASHTARVRVLVGGKKLNFLEGRIDGKAVIARVNETVPLLPMITQQLVQEDDSKSKLIAVGGGGTERKAHRLEIDANRHVLESSTNDVTGADTIKSVAIAAGSPETIVVLTEDGAGAGHIYALDDLTGAWDSSFDTAPDEARPQTLAIDDASAAICIVSKDVNSEFTLTRRESAGAPEVIPVPSDLTSTAAAIYSATHHVRFWPGEDNAWILLLTDMTAGIRTQSLRKLIWDSVAGTSSTVVIHPNTAGIQLSTAPVVRVDTGGENVIVSAWDDGMLRLHRQTGSTAATEIVRIPLASETVTAVALRLEPLCVAVLSTAAAGALPTLHVWEVDEAGGNANKLIEIVPTGPRPADAPMILGWQDDTIFVGTKDGSSSTLQLEYFPLPRVFAPPHEADPTKLCNVLTTAGWVDGDDPVFGTADGRIWALDPVGNVYKLFPDLTTADTGQLVRAMARPATKRIFAFALTLEDQKIRIRKLTTPGSNETLPVIPTINAPVTALAFSTDDKFLAMGATSGLIEIRDLDANGFPANLKATLDTLTFPIQSLSFVTVDHQLRLAAIDHRGKVCVWAAPNDGAAPADAFEPKFVEETELPDIDHQSSLCWSADGDYLAVASQSGNVFVIKVTDAS